MKTIPLQTPLSNRLIAALPASDFARIAGHLESVPMPPGWALYEGGDEMTHAYFPTSGVVALLCETENGDSAEIALTGNEGVVGVALFLGGESMLGRAVVQSAGHAYRMPARLFRQEFEQAGEFQVRLLRFTQALMTQMAQTALCNRHHTIEQQLCRWLLLSLDRVKSNELLMTQDLIATLLGVRREGLGAAAKHLQDAGLILYRRGRITVLERAGLERVACGCYLAVRQETDRLLALPASGRGDPSRDT